MRGHTLLVTFADKTAAVYLIDVQKPGDDRIEVLRKFRA